MTLVVGQKLFQKPNISKNNQTMLIDTIDDDSGTKTGL